MTGPAAIAAKSAPAGSAPSTAVGPHVQSVLLRHRIGQPTPLLDDEIRKDQRRSAAGHPAGRQSLRSRRFTGREAPPDLSRIYLLELGARNDQEVAAVLASLRSMPDVTYAEEAGQARAFYVPNDPHYSLSDSWGQGYEDLHGLHAIGTTAAWDVSRGAGIVVAVVDTGVDRAHPDLHANLWTNSAEIAANGIDDDANGYIDDVNGWDFVGTNSGQPLDDNDPADPHGHGTHVAGTVSATGDNGLGVIGVAWESRIMAIRGLDDGGSGGYPELARAIVYAVDNGAHVINASWGGTDSSNVLADAVAYAHAQGVAIVAAGGNSASDVKKFIPARFPEVIAVAALHPEGYPAYFSNFGLRIDVAAPGEDIRSLEANTGGYRQMSGTSMAAPHVSGSIALLLAANPALSVEQVRQALRSSATDLGMAGHDPYFGSGRIATAAALSAPPPLEVRLHIPPAAEAVRSPIDLVGFAGGPGFARYELEVGAGEAPSTWTLFASSATPVANSILGTFNPATLPDGDYVVRLRAFTAQNAVYTDYVELRVKYLDFTQPAFAPAPGLVRPVKPGVPFEIRGVATGPSFSRYRLEWAAGTSPDFGWSTTGITLPAGGNAPITDGLLGTWVPPANIGDYVLRLTVENAGFNSDTTARVYVDPDLVSNAWPQLLEGTSYAHDTVPVRQADGSTRFVTAAHWVMPRHLRSFSFTGEVHLASLDFGSDFACVVGDLHEHPGEEIVIADSHILRVFSADLVPLKSIPAKPFRVFGRDQTILADLDNDGHLEIITPARDTTLPEHDVAQVYAYRADGTDFWDQPSMPMVAALGTEVRTIAADLDGDGFKEVIFGYSTPDRSAYHVAIVSSEGAHQRTLTFPGTITGLCAANLDGDRTANLVLSERLPDDRSRIVVLEPNGTIRPGWPVETGWNPRIAAGDLDGNSQQEIVVTDQVNVTTLKGDGSPWGASWSLGGDPFYNSVSGPLIADLDGDNVPEILVPLVFSANDALFSRRVSYAGLTSYRTNGSIHRKWRLFGTGGQQPAHVRPLIGDFNGDGQTDILVSVGLIRGGTLSGSLSDSALYCLTLGTPFGDAASEWTGSARDPQSSRSGSVRPAVTRDPLAQSIFRGESTSLTARAGGSPMPAFQWRRDGIPLPGATHSTLDLVSPLASANYDVVVTNRAGTAASQPARVRVVTPASITLTDLFTRYDGQPHRARAVTAPAGLSVALTYNGSAEPPVAAGSYLVRATITDPDYVGSATGTLVIDAYTPGDFNGDGHVDLLWRNARTGQVSMWAMDGLAFAGSASIGTVSIDWQKIGLGDFNDDRLTDLLWRNVSTGEVAVWFLDGIAFAGSASLGQVSLEWDSAGTGDFNHDGHTDLLWRNRSTGQVAVWFFDRAAFAGSASLGTVALDWQSAGTGDFNHDGHTDLLWRHRSTGEVAIWFLDRTLFAGSASLGVVSPTWESAGISDLNGDNESDLIWRHRETGEVSVWLMQGTSLASSASLGQVGLEWRP